METAPRLCTWEGSRARGDVSFPEPLGGGKNEMPSRLEGTVIDRPQTRSSSLGRLPSDPASVICRTKPEALEGGVARPGGLLDHASALQCIPGRAAVGSSRAAASRLSVRHSSGRAIHVRAR